MKALKLSLVAALLLGAPTVYAQSSVKDIVFSAVEKRLVREYYGATANQQTSDNTAPEWAVKDQRERDNGDDDNEDDHEDGDKQGKNDKGKKDKKGKGKDKGKSKHKGLPPGLAKRDQLPPGLQKQLDRNGRLPAGLAKRDLPADLMSKLTKRSTSQDVIIVDNDVVLLDKTTGIILDVIKDVVTNGAGGSASTPNPDGTLADPSPQKQPSDTVLDSILKSIFGN